MIFIVILTAAFATYAGASWHGFMMYTTGAELYAALIAAMFAVGWLALDIVAFVALMMMCAAADH